MKEPSRKKLEVFLLLALNRRTLLNSDENGENIETDEFSEKIFSALSAQMSAPEAENFERMRRDYEKKSEAEKENWRNRVETAIGADESFLDQNIHRSHIDAALRNETAAVGKVLAAGMPPEYQNRSTDKPKNTGDETTRNHRHLEKSVRETFARQFVARQNLPAPTAFDNLSGARLARLIRLAGIREVALACVRISAVESVASFLRRFSAEDARAIAAQLNALPKTSGERLSFAENLVQIALEQESKPSAMLDLLGFRLIGISLCAGTPERVRYTEQKLPLEVEPKLSDVIDAQCRKTPVGLQREVGRQIEQLAETITEI